MRRSNTAVYCRRSTFLVVAVTCILAVPAWWLATAAPPPERPNVVMLVADDLGWNDVGYHGSEIRTPAIDRIATQGVMLERFYAYPLCTPTRVALLSGRSPLSMGLVGPIGPRAKGGLPLDEHLLPQTFKAAGYQTFMTGKWHLGNSHVNYFPHNRGFDHFYGHLGASIDYFTHLFNGGLDWQRNGKSVEEEGYSTELLGDEAVRLIRGRDNSKPMLLYVAFNAVHTPLQAPQSYIDKYAGIEDENRRTYAAMTDAMDTAMGKVLAALEEEDLMGPSTLILFISDNGGNTRGGASNLPLRGQKGEVFEGGIRVPGAIWWPGVLEGGRKSNQFITAHDLLPTLTAAAGVTLGSTKPLYGENMWPAIRDGKTVPRKDFVIGARGSLALFHEQWKLVRNIRRRDQVREEFLFRVGEDPIEGTDLSAKHPEVFNELKAELESFHIPEPIAGSGQDRARRARPGGAGQRGQRAGAERPARRPGGPNANQSKVPTREPYAESAERN